MDNTFSSTALAWGENVIEAALYFENVIPMDREHNFDKELFSVLPDYLKDECWDGVVKELWDVYHTYIVAKLEMSRHSGAYFEDYQSMVEIFENKYSLQMLPKFFSNESDENTNGSETPFLALRNLKIIDQNSLDWIHVLEFRKDSDAFSKIRRLRHFLELNYSGKSKQYIEDDLSIRLEDYHSAISKWGFETKIGTVGIILKSKTAYATLGACLAFAISGRYLPSLASLTTGLLLETGNIVVELCKKIKEKDALKRNNPFDFLLEFNKNANR